MNLNEIPKPEKTGKEPKWHPSIKPSFLFVKTAGMRLAPELLVLELFREVFYHENFAETVAKKDFDLEAPHYSESERLVLYAVRGRNRRARKKSLSGAPIYCPAYPVQARDAWLRSKTDRVIRDFLLEGPIRQYSFDHNLDEGKVLEISNCITAGLAGHNAATPEDYSGKEFLSVPLKDIPASGSMDLNGAPGKLAARTREYSDEMKLGHPDVLAERIAIDFIHLCKAEKVLGRIQWLSLLKAFLRLSTSSWLLAQMSLSIKLRDWLVGTLDGSLTVPEESEIISKLTSRHDNLFIPNIVPGKPAEHQVELYMKARVELNILLRWVDALTGNALDKKQLVVSGKKGGTISIPDLLKLAEQVGEKLTPGDRKSLKDTLVRQAENFEAWNDPLNNGQGKNFNEFLLVLKRNNETDGDQSYLLTPAKAGSFTVFPGPEMLITIIFLAAAAKEKGSGKLMLSDIEAHLASYGVNFISATARPRLIQKLQEMGLLKGSPDAGDSVEILLPIENA